MFKLHNRGKTTLLPSPLHNVSLIGQTHLPCWEEKEGSTLLTPHQHSPNYITGSQQKCVFCARRSLLVIHLASFGCWYFIFCLSWLRHWLGMEGQVHLAVKLGKETYDPHQNTTLLRKKLMHSMCSSHPSSVVFVPLINCSLKILNRKFYK